MDYGGFTAMPGGTMTMIPKLNRGLMRRNVDYASSVITYLEDRIWQRGKRDRPIVQPDLAYVSKMVPPLGSEEDPVTAITTKFVKTVYNKQRCPIFCTSWAPDGRRLVAGAASGEFSLWSGISLNFESLIKAHEGSVRCMQWSHNSMWLASTDDRGIVKYWQSNMNNVHSFQAHNETIRGCSFSPTDSKLATCSDDGTVRIFDVLRSSEEFILRGHGADVKCVDWHPRKNLVVSGSKDNQQPIKLWDPKTGQGVSTLHAHKAAVTCVRWNRNGNWLLTASRDHLIKLYDIRTMKELDVLKGHKSDVNTVSWHPVHEKLFCSGGSDGAILFWLVGNKRDIGGMESPHDSFVWSLSWHPLGHMLCSGSNDHTCKFWCRNRPGDEMKDRHTSGGLPVEEIADTEIFEGVSLPGAHSNITLPPPNKGSGTVILPAPPVNTTWSSNQATQPPDKTPVPSTDILQVLGADIIKEQFGKPNTPTGPPAQNQTPQNPLQAKSGLFMHLQGGGGGGETKEGDQQPPEFGSPFHPGQSPPSFPHQNPPHPPPGGGMGSPGMRGLPPLQNFHGPRPPPPVVVGGQQQGRRDWHEGAGEFPGGRPRYPPHDFPHRNFGVRSNVQSNPFSWQRQDPGRDRPVVSLEEEGMRFFNEQGHNPYVYRREEGNSRLRDPREQRIQQQQQGPGMGGGVGENSRRPSQDEQMDWQQHGRGGRGPPGWHRDHRGGPPGQNPPNPPRGPDDFHGHEHRGPPPTQEHFDQRRGSEVGERVDTGPTRDVERAFPDGNNWQPPFQYERPPPHDRPQGNLGPPPQRPEFPPDRPNFRAHPPPQSEQEQAPPVDPGKRGPPMNIPPGAQQGVGGPGGGPPRPGGGPPNIHDPRSQQRAQLLPASEPNRPQFPLREGPPQHFPGGVDPNRKDIQHREGGQPPRISPQVRDPPHKLPDGPPQQHHVHEGPPRLPPPHLHEGHRLVPQQGNDGPHPMPPRPHEGPPHPHEGPPRPHEGPPHSHEGPPRPHEGPSRPHEGPPHSHEGPPRPHEGLPRPHEGPPRSHEGPPHPHEGLPHPHEGPPRSHEGPPHPHEGLPRPHEGPPRPHEGPPRPHEGPPRSHEGPPRPHEGPPRPHEGPPRSHEGPPHPLPLQVHDGPPHRPQGPPLMPPSSREGPLKNHEGPPHPPHPHMQGHPRPDVPQQGPPQHPSNIHEGPPPQHPVQMPPQQAPHEGPPLHGNPPPPQGPPHQHEIHGGPPQHIHEGPPHQIHDGPHHEGPPHQIRDGPPIHANSPQHLNPPQRFEEFRDQPGGHNSPRSIDSPVTSQPHHFAPTHSHGGPPRFPGPHPPHNPREQEHFGAPQNFQDQRGPHPNMQGPPPSQNFPGPPPHGPMQREDFDQFPQDQRPPPQQPLPGPSDPRRQHPQQNFQGGPPDNREPVDRYPPQHPRYHPQHGQPPHRQPPHDGPPPEIDWGNRQQPPPQQQQQQRHNSFPRDPGGRFEVNRDRDPHDRRVGGRGGGDGGREGRDGRDKRERDRDRDRDGRGRSQRERSPKHSSRDGQPAVKRLKSDRERESSSSKHSGNNRREKNSRK